MKKSITVLLFVFLSVNLFAQNGTRLIGFDARSMGRGGTSIGFFDGNELMMTNPGGITFLNSSKLSVGISGMAPSIHFNNSINNMDGDKNIFLLPNASYVNKYKKDSKFTWGIGFFTQGGMGADLQLNNELYRGQSFNYNASDSTYYPTKGDYSKQKYHSKFAVMQGGLSGSYAINNNLSVGISAHLLYSMMEFTVPYSLNPLIMKGVAIPGMTFGQLFSAPPSMGGFGYSEVTASAEMKDLNVITFNGKLGLAYKVNDMISFGLSYTMPTKLNYKNGKASMDMSKQFEDALGRSVTGYYSNTGNHGKPIDSALYSIAMNFAALGIDMNKTMKSDYDLEVEMKLPQTIGFGMSLKPSDNVKLGFDFEWINWSKAFDKMTIKLSNGQSENINKMMGGNTIDVDFPLNWNDAVVLKVGGEYYPVNELALRLGYVYGSNPVPASTIFPVFPAIVDHRITLGAGYKFTENVTCNFAYEAAFNKKLGGSTPHSVASEYAGSTSELMTTLLHFSFEWNF
jgi:long-chain fatty acid transport protein